jgi:ABC-type lipoprotein export system ATPase subunit
MTINTAGSTWKKWDLHVHSPASLVHGYDGANNEERWENFLSDLEKLPSDFKVIGINDYIFVDGYERVLKEKAAGRLKNIDLFLPVIELRLDKFAGTVKKDVDGTFSKSDWNRINLHIVFDQLDPDLIRQQFLAGLVQCYDLIPESSHFQGRWQAVITQESLRRLGEMIIESVPEALRGAYGNPLQEGFNNLCVSLEKVLAALNRHDLTDRYLLAVGKSEWENMKWTDQSIAEKKNVINHVDMVFTAAANPAAYAKAKAGLEASNVNARLLDCSDAHALSNSPNKDRVGNCFTWIKADCTFQGLLHAVAEFDQRVFVGDIPPKHLLVSANRTKYIKSLSVKKRSGSTLSDEWFDVDLPISHDLVAVIGNKGSGKSALADIVALVGDTRNHPSFSFLVDTRFRDPRAKLASHFIGALSWHDNSISRKDLHENPAASSVERVKYLPQRYLETLCNELAGEGSSTFDGELRKIIYTHVPEEQRIGFGSLDELLSFKLSELAHEHQQLAEEIGKLSNEIAALEIRLRPEFRTGLDQRLEAKKRELAALDSAKPSQVEDPTASEAAKQEAAEASGKLSELEAKLKVLAAEEQAARQRKADALKLAAQLTRILQAVKNHQKAHDQFVADLSAMLVDAKVEVSAADLVHLSVDVSGIQTRLDFATSESVASDKILEDPGQGGFLHRRSVLDEAVKELKSKLGEKQRLFLLYREQIAQWEKAKADITGDAERPNSLLGLAEEIAHLHALPERRTQLRAIRRDRIRSLHRQIGKMAAEYRSLYEPVQRFVESAASMEVPLPLAFDVRVVEERFQDEFLSRINRQTKGSFSGIEESELLVRRMLKETDFTSEEAVVSFVERIDDMLHFDRRTVSVSAVELSVPDQLRKGQTAEDLYTFLASLPYLRPQYSLTYDKQEISQLSPGERGLLLLVFYLLVDKDDIPLLIDQPEENLDNQTIFKVLVQCIRTAKARRQVIMVTHNPNLAVVCDAEQIIYASCDKAGKRFTYISGAIESAPIKERVIEILEGTQPAFDNRKRKYGI